MTETTKRGRPPRYEGRPGEPGVDHLQRHIEGSKPDDIEVWELDLERYWAGLRAGGAVVLWGKRSKASKNDKGLAIKECEVLSRSLVSHIRNSPLSSEFYASVYEVPEWKVLAVRGEPVSLVKVKLGSA